MRDQHILYELAYVNIYSDINFLLTKKKSIGMIDLLLIFTQE